MDAGEKLLLAVEALMGEVRRLNERISEIGDATKTLQTQRAKKAERQARWREKHTDEPRSVSVASTCSVSVTSTGGVVKALDLDQELSTKRDPRVDATKTLHVDATPPPTNAVWKAYSEAFERRYSVKPTRNRRINGMLSQFVKAIPADDAPAVAEFYVSHNGAFYVQKTHAVKFMLGDAEGLWTQWKNGRPTTSTSARQQDKTQANLDGWAKHLSPEARNALVAK